MAENVVSISHFQPKKPDIVYQCEMCGGQLFYIAFDEKEQKPVVECRVCKSISHNLAVVEVEEE